MELALGTTEWYSKVMYVQWKLVSVCFEIVLVLAKDRCTVCAECTSGMEIALGSHFFHTSFLFFIFSSYHYGINFYLKIKKEPK